MTPPERRPVLVRMTKELRDAVERRRGDVPLNTYMIRLAEADTGLRPAPQGNGVVPAAELDPSVGAAASPPSGAVPSGPVEPSPVADVDDEPEPLEVDPSEAEHRPPTRPPRRRAPRSAEEWGR